jgi:hypothetical protein
MVAEPHVACTPMDVDQQAGDRGYAIVPEEDA